jgi:hypothetical protein
MNHVQKKMSIGDPDLSPEHDNIMFKLSRYVDEFLLKSHELNNHKGEWTEFKTHFDYHCYVNDKIKLFIKDNLLNLTQLAGPPPVRLDNIHSIWEYPILAGRSAPIAFADLVIRKNKSYLHLNVSVKRRYKNENDSIDNVLLMNGDDNYYDIVFKAGWNVNDITEITTGYEVKPIVRSIGEVLRQVKRYRAFMPYENWIVVAPHDDGLKSILNREGFGFLSIEEIDTFLKTKEVEKCQVHFLEHIQTFDL